MQRRYLSVQYDAPTMAQVALALRAQRKSWERNDCIEVTPYYRWLEGYCDSLSKHYTADAPDAYTRRNLEQDTQPVMMLTLAQASQRANVSLRTIKRHVANGDLKVWRKGRIVRITLEAFDEWLNG